MCRHIVSMFVYCLCHGFRSVVLLCCLMLDGFLVDCCAAVEPHFVGVSYEYHDQTCGPVLFLRHVRWVPE